MINIVQNYTYLETRILIFRKSYTFASAPSTNTSSRFLWSDYDSTLILINWNLLLRVKFLTQWSHHLSTSFPGSSLFLPRESTLVSADHVSPLSKQLPTRVDSLFFKKRREKRMQIFSNWHEDRGMEVISSLFFKDKDAKKIYSLQSAAFQKHK